VVDATSNKAIVDIRLRPWCRILTISTKHCSCLTFNWYRHYWRTLLNNVVLDSGPLVPWYENLTSSVKPEVHNLSQRRQRTERRPQATCTKIWWSSGMWFSSYTNGQTDKQTN